VRVTQARRPDALAAVAAILAAVMMIVYVLLMRQQGDTPLLWVLGLLGCGALLSAYGASRTRPHRQAALLVSGAMLSVLGLLAILSIGLPVVVAGVLSVVAAARSPHPTAAQPGGDGPSGLSRLAA
jgi:drug/metabolite transporter (DMT)-like permease